MKDEFVMRRKKSKTQDMDGVCRYDTDDLDLKG